MAPRCQHPPSSIATIKAVLLPPPYCHAAAAAAAVSPLLPHCRRRCQAADALRPSQLPCCRHHIRRCANATANLLATLFDCCMFWPCAVDTCRCPLPPSKPRYRHRPTATVPPPLPHCRRCAAATLLPVALTPPPCFRCHQAAAATVVPDDEDEDEDEGDDNVDDPLSSGSSPWGSLLSSSRFPTHAELSGPMEEV